MANNVLLGDWRLRVSAANNKNFVKATRLCFFDAETMAVKEVFSSYSDEVGMGNIVDLDGSGYVPVSGVWLGLGAYSCRVEQYAYTDEFDTDIYDPLWTIPFIPGATAPADGTDGVILENMAQLRAYTPDGNNVTLMGYYTTGDMISGSPFYKWDATSLLTDDEGSVIKPTSYSTVDEGRWIRLFDRLPTIRDFGAVPGQANAKVRILNAQQYATNNGTVLAYPAGAYLIAGEPLTILSDSKIEEGFTLPDAGTLTINGADIEAESAIAASIIITGVERLRPEWWDAELTSDSVKAAYANSGTYGGTVYLTGAYTLAGGSFNTDTSMTTIVGPDASIVVDGSMATSTLGSLIVEGSKPFLDGDFNDLVIVSGYKSSYFVDLSVTDLSRLLQNPVDFVFTADFTFDQDFASTSNSKLLLESGVKFTISSGKMVTFSQRTWDLSNFDSIESVTRIESDVILTNKFASAASLSADIQFNHIVLNNMRVYINTSTSIKISGPSIVFNDSSFEGTNNEVVFITTNQTQFNRCSTSDVDIVIKNNVAGYIKNVRFNSCELNVTDAATSGGRILFKAAAIDVLAKGVHINHCNFGGLLSGTVANRKRINSSVLSFSNFYDGGIAYNENGIATAHDIDISDNALTSFTETETEMQYLPQTSNTGIFELTTADTAAKENLVGGWESSVNMTDVPVDLSSDNLFVLAGNDSAPVNIQYDNAKIAYYVTDPITSTTFEIAFVSLSTGGNKIVTVKEELYKMDLVYSDISDLTLLRSDMSANITPPGPLCSVEFRFNYTISTYK